MHKYLSLFLILFFAAFAVNAQQQKYYRVQIFTNDRGLQQLAAAGVTIDHGEYVKDVSFSSDFSEKELALIKRSGHKYTVLIEDMAAYYVARNAGEKFETAAASFTTACGTYPVPKNITAGSMGGFYTYTELLAVLDSMASKFPKLITAKQLVSSTLTTAEGRPLYYVKISDKPNKNENEPKVLYTALHHAREPESITQLIYYMWFLLENYRKDAFVKSLVDSTEMYFIPCVNPDGYIYNQATNPNGGGYWRKNRLNNGDGTFGVDLNRNYAYKWGFDNIGSSPSTWSDVYRGSAPFSEAETKMTRDFCNRIPFSYAINNHTYGNYLIYPYGYKANTYTPDSAKFVQESNLLAACNLFTKGTTIQTVGYTANGGSDDWMYGEQSTKSKVFAYTAETGSSFDGFWPRKSRILPLAQANIDMNLTLARLTKESAAPPVGTAITGIVKDDFNLLQTAEMYAAPNPGKTYTYINYKINEAVKTGKLMLVIMNADGRQIQTVKLNLAETRILINTSRFKPGMYYYRITDGMHVSVNAKFVVVN